MIFTVYIIDTTNLPMYNRLFCTRLCNEYAISSIQQTTQGDKIMSYWIPFGILAVVALSFVKWCIPFLKQREDHNEKHVSEETPPPETEVANREDYDNWLLEPGEQYVRIPHAGTHTLLSSTVPPEDILAGNFKKGQWIDFVVGYRTARSPSFRVGGEVQKSRMVTVCNEPARETVLTCEKDGMRIVLLLSVAINQQEAIVMITGAQ
jgi:hypothetical protein